MIDAVDETAGGHPEFPSNLKRNESVAEFPLQFNAKKLRQVFTFNFFFLLLLNQNKTIKKKSEENPARLARKP